MSLALLGRIAIPDPFDGVRKELHLGITNAVAGVPTEKILVVIALGLQYFGPRLSVTSFVIQALTKMRDLILFVL